MTGPVEQQQPAQGGEAEPPLQELAALGRMRAPEDFAGKVTETIHRRSRGRFFARRTLGDRLPLGLLAVLALGAGLAVYAWMRWSSTGTLSPRPGAAEPPVLAPGARDAIPRP